MPLCLFNLPYLFWVAFLPNSFQHLGIYWQYPDVLVLKLVVIPTSQLPLLSSSLYVHLDNNNALPVSDHIPKHPLPILSVVASLFFFLPAYHYLIILLTKFQPFSYFFGYLLAFTVSAVFCSASTKHVWSWQTTLFKIVHRNAGTLPQIPNCVLSALPQLPHFFSLHLLDIFFFNLYPEIIPHTYTSISHQNKTRLS